MGRHRLSGKLSETRFLKKDLLGGGVRETELSLNTQNTSDIQGATWHSLEVLQTTT